MNDGWGEGPMGFESRMADLVVARFEQLAERAGYPVHWFPSLSEVHGDVELDVEPEALDEIRQQATTEVWQAMIDDSGPMADKVRDHLLPEKEIVELLIVYPQTAAKAWEILDEDAHLFDDNGGDPDGPSYYLPTAEFDAEDVEAIVAGRLGYVAQGWHEEGYTGSDYDRQRMAEVAPHRWCGFSSRGDLYYIIEA